MLRYVAINRVNVFLHFFRDLKVENLLLDERKDIKIIGE